MARKAAATAGTLTILLSGLSVVTCDSVELDGSFVNVTNDAEGRSYRLPAATTVFGQDADGGWYASLNAVRKETIEVDSIETTAEGLLATAGKDAFVYVPAAHMSRVSVEGDIAIAETEVEPDEPEEQEPEVEEPPARSRRRSR